MRNISLNLTSDNQSSGSINLEFTEDYLFIELADFAPEHFLTITTKIRGQETTKIIKCAKIMRVTVFGFTSFTISSNLLEGEKIEGKIHMGTWDEILIEDLAKNLDHHFQSYNDCKNHSIQIGLSNCAHLKVVLHDAEHYNLIRKIALPNGGAAEKDKMIHRRSDIGLRIDRIYNQIKQNLANETFVQQQTRCANELQQKTIEFCKFY
jgi:hypothetical protein